MMDTSTFQLQQLLQDDQEVFFDESQLHPHHGDYMADPYHPVDSYAYNEPTYMNLTSPAPPPSYCFHQNSYQWTPYHQSGGSYLQPLIKLEDTSYLTSDEGFGSSSSSFKSMSPPVDSTPQRGSDSDVSEGLLPPMTLFRKQCVNCGTSQCLDDQWTVEASGHLLCNACAQQPPPEDTAARKRNRNTAASSRRSQISCINCTTTVTSLWRRNPKGEFVCNACGLYEKLHKRQRPISMRKDSIQKRKRRPRNENAKKKGFPTETQLRRQNNLLHMQYAQLPPFTT